jgi:hypothetical protein
MKIMDEDRSKCKEIFESLSDYVDGDLDEGMCNQIRQHMQDCPPCEKFFEGFRRSIEASKFAGKTVDSTPPLPEDIKSALRAVLKQKLTS